MFRHSAGRRRACFSVANTQYKSLSYVGRRRELHSLHSIRRQIVWKGYQQIKERDSLKRLAKETRQRDLPKRFIFNERLDFWLRSLEPHRMHLPIWQYQTLGFKHQSIPSCSKFSLLHFYSILARRTV